MELSRLPLKKGGGCQIIFTCITIFFPALLLTSLLGTAGVTQSLSMGWIPGHITTPLYLLPIIKKFANSSSERMGLCSDSTVQSFSFCCIWKCLLRLALCKLRPCAYYTEVPEKLGKQDLLDGLNQRYDQRMTIGVIKRMMKLSCGTFITFSESGDFLQKPCKGPEKEPKKNSGLWHTVAGP